MGGAFLNPAWAETVTYKLTITASDFNTTSYDANNNEKTSDAVCTTDNTKKFSVKWTSYQVMKSSTNMQWQKSKGYIYNSTDLGTITSVTVTSSAGTFTTYYGTSAQPSSGDSDTGKGFFKTSVGSVTGTSSKLEITFQIEEVSPTTCATPTFSPVAGAVAYGTEVTLKCATDGATIYYTTDGLAPTSTSATYSSPIAITADKTIKAIAVKDGLTNSDVATATYTIAAPATPSFSPAAGAVYYGTEITLTSDEGTTIYYTTDGSTPNNESNEYNPNDKPTVTAACTIKAIAFDAGGNASSVGSAAYTMKSPDAPSFSLDEGMVLKGASLVLSTTSEGASIHYTTDGTTPSASVGTVYSSPITINANQTINAIAYDPAGNVSSVVTKAYTVFTGEVVTFDATEDVGTSQSKNGVSFTTSATESSVYKFYKSSSTTFSTTAGKIKKIEFTGVNGYAISNMTTSTGTLATSSSPDGVWTGSVTSVTFTASKAQTRATLIKVYVAKTAAPAFSVTEGEYSEAKSVTITCATDDAVIYYTTDGSTPTSSSTTYSSAISVTETMTLKAIAIYDGVESPVTSATYTMNRPAAPEFDKPEGYFNASFDLHLSTKTDDATIFYTTDGSLPTTSSSVYSTKVAIAAATTTVKAIAVKSGLTSDVSSATYTYDTRPAPTFTLSDAEMTILVLSDDETITLTTNSDGAVTYTSSDNTKLDVDNSGDSKIGVLTALEAGDYTITVQTAATSNYLAGEGTVTVHVVKKATTMSIETDFSDGRDLKDASTGLIEGIVKYNNVDLSPQPTITYSSSDESVATVDEDGVITFVKAGSTTLTVSYAGDDEYAACEETYELVLVDTTPQETSIDVTTDYKWLGLKSSGKNVSADDCPLNIDCSGVTVTVDGSGTYPRGDDDYIRLYAKSSLMLTAPTGYYITKVEFNHQAGTNTVNVSTGEWNGTTHVWTGATSSVTFTIGGSSGNNQINGFTITLAETVTIGSAGYTTYVAKHDISFPDAVTAYIATASDASTVTLTSKESVPEGTAIVVKGEAGTYALPTITTTPDDVSDNILLASDGSVKGDGSTIYALGVGKTGDSTGKVGFYLVGGNVVIPAGKAYLNLGGSPAKEFLTFDFSETPDGIKTLSQTPVKEEGIYNLSGQRLNKMQKGINIVNGKKVLY